MKAVTTFLYFGAFWQLWHRKMSYLSFIVELRPSDYQLFFTCWRGSRS